MLFENLTILIYGSPFFFERTKDIKQINLKKKKKANLKIA